MTARQLDREARAHLRGLTKDNAEVVARHLVMAGRLIDDDPELAYEHAQAAVRRGGRIDVVREAAGLTAYRLGSYAEALRELRTVRRLNGSSEHLAVMADCERGLGRPERAIELSQSAEAATLGRAARFELALVVSGARVDLGQAEAATAVLAGVERRGLAPDDLRRLDEARIAVAEASGEEEAAAALRARLGEVEDDEEFVVFDLEDEPVADPPADRSAADDTAADDTAADDTAADDTAADEDETLEPRQDGVQPDQVAADGSEPTEAVRGGEGPGESSRTPQDARDTESAAAGHDGDARPEQPGDGEEARA